jgi:predicted metal-dependent peptidase
VATWIRRDYDGVGVTQSPPGRYLAKVAEPYLGKVLLCIDVSGSMAGRLHHAVAGAERFVAEAVAAHYEVGLVLWNSSVAGFVPLSRRPAPVLAGLRTAAAGGGTNVTPTLELGIRELGKLTGDRVMAIFGDGDIGRVSAAQDAARRAAALGIRIIVRGFGDRAAAQLRLIASDADEPETVVRTESGIEAGVASMITRVVRGVGRRD